MKKRLYRSKSDRVIAGVCGGVAKYFNIDATIVRVLFVVFAFQSIQIMFLVYVVALIVIPEGSKTEWEIEDEDDEADETSHKSEPESKDTRQLLGAILIGAGILILMSKMINWFDTGMILAVGVIALGVYILTHKK